MTTVVEYHFNGTYTNLGRFMPKSDQFLKGNFNGFLCAGVLSRQKLGTFTVADFNKKSCSGLKNTTA